MENQTQTTSSYTQKKRIVAFILLCIIFITGISIWYFISKKIEEKSVAVPISPARKLQILTEESAKTTIDPKKDTAELTQLQKKSTPVKINTSRQEKIFEILNNRK